MGNNEIVGNTTIVNQPGSPEASSDHKMSEKTKKEKEELDKFLKNLLFSVTEISKIDRDRTIFFK